MAKASGAILNDALENWARRICNDSPAGPTYYAGMGAGESNTVAQAGDHDLLGADVHYNDADGSYEANYKAVWQSIFVYGDLTGHIIKELVICQSLAVHDNKCLLRLTIDAITLNADEQVSIIIKNVVQQGS